jgi:hypothetical protein
MVCSNANTSIELVYVIAVYYLATRFVLGKAGIRSDWRVFKLTCIACNAIVKTLDLPHIPSPNHSNWSPFKACLNFVFVEFYWLSCQLFSCIKTLDSKAKGKSRQSLVHLNEKFVNYDLSRECRLQKSSLFLKTVPQSQCMIYLAIQSRKSKTQQSRIF